MSDEIKKQETSDNVYIGMPGEVPSLSLDGEKKNMRRAFSRCGWAVFIATLSGFVLALGLGEIAANVEWLGNFVYNVNLYMYVNEAIIAITFLLGALALIGMPKKKPERKPVKVKSFIAMFCICASIGAIGNVIGNIILTVWNFITGGSAENPLTEVLMSVNPMSMIICVAILAPVLEEFFFRKLLLDRMYPYGERTAILVSAIAFGLFHQNFSQFFYAFGIGLVLGYLYCKTGSYKAVTLLHMAFNFIFGVIPSILSKDVLTFAEEMETIAGSNTDALVSLMIRYALPLALYFIYLLVSGAFDIAGIVLFCMNAKKIKVEKSESALPVEDRVLAVTVNVGVILALVLLIFLTVLSLFSL